ncbi:putative caffeine synthase 4 [Drosera capensis]
MEVEQVFHVKEGTGEASYANNSQLQKLVISKAKTMVETSLKEMFSTMLPECLMVADLGCAQQRNSSSQTWPYLGNEKIALFLGIALMHPKFLMKPMSGS